MKVLRTIAQWLFVLCLPFFAFTASIAWAVNSPWLYTSLFDKYDVAQSLADNGLPVTKSDLNDVSHGFIRYVNSGEENINLSVDINGQAVPLFNDEEISHFKDVKALFRMDYAVLLGTFLYCLFFVIGGLFRAKGKYRPMLARSTITGGILTLGIMALLGIATVVNFDGFWLVFHYIAFSNSFWSAEGNMLLLFPEGFWYDMVVYVAVFTAILLVVLGGIAGVYLYRNRTNKKSRISPAL
jgi:integral membrane protein (TIGR01906 family)